MAGGGAKGSKSWFGPGLPYVAMGSLPGHLIVIEGTDPLPAQIDGEVLLERRYEISMLPGAITCIVPKEGA